VAAAGRIYVVDRDGNAVTLRDGGEYEVLATSSLDDGFDASPAIVGNTLYLRGRHHLYAIAAVPEAEPVKEPAEESESETEPVEDGSTARPSDDPSTR
jgi:hypothetical protein